MDSHPFQPLITLLQEVNFTVTKSNYKTYKETNRTEKKNRNKVMKIYREKLDNNIIST